MQTSGLRARASNVSVPRKPVGRLPRHPAARSVFLPVEVPQIFPFPEVPPRSSRPLSARRSVPTPTLGSHTKLSRLLDDAVARILFAQGNQQGLHLPAVVLDD
jgi:hypothetical protein